jgi:uncharacterized protein YndB with AHSA1/START domain
VTPPATPPAVRLERLVPAPIDAVFDAWTDAATMRLWFSPEGAAHVEADPRPGGLLRVVMSGEGTVIEHVGRYVELVRPHRLVFTWQSAYTGGRETVVAVELSARGSETWLSLTHEWLPPDRVDSHRGGWGAIVDRLATTLAGPGRHAREEAGPWRST